MRFLTGHKPVTPLCVERGAAAAHLAARNQKMILAPNRMMRGGVFPNALASP